MLIPAGIVAVSLLLSVNGFSQNRKLPDGTIVYSDGTKKLPNGTVIYKDGTAKEKGTTVKLPDGRVVLPDGSGSYPNDRRHSSRKNGKLLPPGQAKKVYGGSATDYAPGQQKKWKKNHKDWKKDKDEKKENHEDHGRGKGH